MNYTKIKMSDIANGPGVRSSIYVSGCTHNCHGCFNPETHDFNSGKPWTKDIEDKIIKHVNDDNLSGLNILGGDPLQQIKDDDLINFMKRFKAETHKDIWLWTGYTFEDIINTESKACNILKECDIVVDGEYVEALSDIRLRYMGSSNQRVIDVKKSLQQHKTVLWKGDQ